MDAACLLRITSFDWATELEATQGIPSPDKSAGLIASRSIVDSVQSNDDMLAACSEPCLPRSLCVTC